MVSTCTPISKYSIPFNKPLGIVLGASITISITVTFMFHIFFQFSGNFLIICLSFCFYFYSVVCQDRKVCYSAGFLLFCWVWLGLVVWPQIGWSVCISKSQRSSCLISLNGFWFVHIPLHRMNRLKFLTQFPYDQIPHPPMSYHILFFRFIIIIVIIIIIIIALKWLVFMALFCAAIYRDLVSLFKSPLRSHIQAILYAMFLV